MSTESTPLRTENYYIVLSEVPTKFIVHNSFPICSQHYSQ